jgi:hypothetical protein
MSLLDVLPHCMHFFCQLTNAIHPGKLDFVNTCQKCVVEKRLPFSLIELPSPQAKFVVGSAVVVSSNLLSEHSTLLHSNQLIGKFCGSYQPNLSSESNLLGCFCNEQENLHPGSVPFNICSIHMRTRSNSGWDSEHWQGNSSNVPIQDLTNIYMGRSC